MAIKTGTARTIDENGEVVKTERNAMALLPPSPYVCQECAVEHGPCDPHDQQSVYYQVLFRAKHGRYATWSDAMEHCTPETRAAWRRDLVDEIKKAGVEIPADLRDKGATDGETVPD